MRARPGVPRRRPPRPGAAVVNLKPQTFEYLTRSRRGGGVRDEISRDG